MTDEQNNELNEAASSTTGKGKSGKSGRASGGGIKLPPNLLKEVTSNWEYLDANKAAARVAEFFSEGVARASAHAVVVWGDAKEATFTILVDFLKWGKDVQRLMHNLTRESIQILQERYNLILSGPSG